jgi:hypothetical protein
MAAHGLDVIEPPFAAFWLWCLIKEHRLLIRLWGQWVDGRELAPVRRPRWQRDRNAPKRSERPVTIGCSASKRYGLTT